MDSNQLCKLFIGGLNVQTTEAGLRSHFETYGQLTDCVVVVHPQTKRSRCFGFVTYSSPEEADAAMEASPHVVDGSNVELKRAVSREDSARPGAHAKVKKLFIGGLKGDIQENDLLECFSKFGEVEKAEIVADKVSGQKRGFGFVFFSNHDSADKAAVVKFHSINGNRVEVKKAVPKEELHGSNARPLRGARGRGNGGTSLNGFSGFGRESFEGYGGVSQGSNSYGGYNTRSAYDTFGNYSQHQSNYGPIKPTGNSSWSRGSSSGPYRGGYGVGHSYGGSFF